MSRRKVCRACYNKEKVIQRQNRIPNEREEECRKCFHYTNLQPLFAADNLSKGGKYEASIEN